MVGKEALVEPERKKFSNQYIEKVNESNNKWSNKEYLPDEEALITSKKLEIAIKKISDLEEKIKNLKKS